MSKIAMNEIQLISSCEKCLEESSSEGTDLTFEDCIEFMNTAVGIDYHGDEINEYIKNFVADKK